MIRYLIRQSLLSLDFLFLIAVCYGSVLVVRGELTVGDLVTFTTYLGTLVWPMLAFGWLFNIMERGRASYDRVEKNSFTKNQM